MSFIRYFFSKRITPQEVLLGIFGGYLSYMLLAVFNMTNEDVYNWDVALIFSEGGVSNSIFLVLFWIWRIVMIIWITRVTYRVFTSLVPRK